MRPTRAALFLAAAVALAPGEAHAQRFGQPPRAGSPQEGGWAPAWAGFRGGWDYEATAPVIGIQLRVPAIPSGRLEVVPTADVTFLDGLREYQAGVDAILVSGGRRGGVYVGGGLAWRNSVYTVGNDRETRRAPVVVVGARTGAMMGAPFGTQVEMRWVRLDGPYDPRILSLGVNFPLWGRGRGR